MLTRRWMLIAPLALSSCALLSPAKPDRIFALTPLPPSPPRRCRFPALAVAEPTALALFDTARILNRPDPHEFAYYSGAVWEDRVPALLQHLIIESLRNQLAATITPDQLAVQTTTLATDVQDFQIEPGNTVHVTLAANVAGETRLFESRQTAASDHMADLVLAFDAAVGEVMRGMVGWLSE